MDFDSRYRAARRRSEHGIQLMCYLAREGGDVLISADRCAAALSVCTSSVASLLEDLRRSGLIRSVRGRAGGYYLPKASMPTVGAIVRAVDGVLVYGHSRSRRDASAALLWNNLESCILRVLDRVTLDDIIKLGWPPDAVIAMLTGVAAHAEGRRKENLLYE